MSDSRVFRDRGPHRQPIEAPAEPPPLRVPAWPLPPYRFVPGLNPHPYRNPAGHMYTDGSPPMLGEGLADAERRYLRGLDFFDHRYLWESHEIWEALWRALPPSEPMHQLLQGLIQAGAFLLKHHMGHHRAAQSLLIASQRRLDRVARELPGAGPPLAVLSAQLEAFPQGGPWPRVSAITDALTPSGLQWPAHLREA